MTDSLAVEARGLVKHFTSRKSVTKAVDGIDAGLVTLYDRLRNQLGGLGAAVLNGRRCEGCRLELNPSDVAAIKAKGPEQVARCEECSRILVRLDA